MSDERGIGHLGSIAQLLGQLVESFDDLADAMAGAFTAPSSTFANLPAGATGMFRVVTDSNTNTWGATIAGGGANVVLAWYNGSNWTVVGK